jgi:DNA-binding LacI/PurR family transcriptional regulator
VGKDYSLLSFDDNNKYQDYNLTTVAPALEAIADCLGELICRQVDAATGEIHHIKIASRLIERATCKSQPEGSHA